MNVCIVADCTKPVRSRYSDYCGMHYHRMYRHGSVDKVARGAGVPTVSAGRRYVGVYVPTHPLATKNGTAYVHQVVLYDKIGPGPHQCHWCGAPVHWDRRHAAKDRLQVDHLNNIGDDNRPENVVPSCMSCNVARGAQRRAQALRDAGWWAGHDTVAHTGAGRANPIEAA